MAVAASSAGGTGVRHLPMLSDAEQKLKDGDDVAAVVDLMAAEDLLTKGGTARPPASETPGNASDVLRRLVNQVLLFGSISPAASAGTITCGQTLPGQISNAGQTDSYTFSGNAGEAVQVTAATTTGTLCTRTNLFNPTGGFMGTTSCNSSNGPFVLPSTGTYRIDVFDDNLTDLGTYNLNLQFLTGRCAGSITWADPSREYFG